MKIVFMGTPSAAVPSLDRLIADGHEVVAVYTQPDRPSGRGNKIVSSPVKQLATDHDLKVLQPPKIKTDGAYEEFLSNSADAAIVVAYGRILPERFLTAFPRGAINLHFSLLPKYRGAAPVNWAIANGETETGVTTMEMDTGLDTGPMLLQRKVAIDATETSIDLMSRLSVIGADILAETLAELSSIVAQPQNDADATFAPILEKEDGRIDWNRPAMEIADRVRGFQPFPSSFTYLNGVRITLWMAESVYTVDDATPGTVVTAWGDELVVASGPGTMLCIGEIQPEGKRRMSVRDFINGSDIAPGSIMGD